MEDITYNYSLLLKGLGLIIIGVIFINFPLTLLRGYEYFKNDKKKIKSIKIFHNILGIIFTFVGALIVIAFLIDFI